MPSMIGMPWFLLLNFLSLSIRTSGLLSLSPILNLRSRAKVASGRLIYFSDVNSLCNGKQQLSCMNSVSKFSANEINVVPTASVEEVLQSISNSDAGANASKELQMSVSAWSLIKSNEYAESLVKLNEMKGHPTEGGVTNTDDNELTALDDENLFGNYDVAFVSTISAKKQEGNPAGGNFRGSFGRFIYQNEGIYQHILKENDIDYDSGIIKTKESTVFGDIDNITNDVVPEGTSKNVSQEPSPEVAVIKQEDSPVKSRILAINYITGKLFRIFPVSVILKGVVSKISKSECTELTAKYGTLLSSGTVRADFESPLISLGKYSVRIGPNSNVVLDTPYLDKNIRLGLGARGSAFIFKKTNDKKADNWKIDIQRKPLNAKKLGFSLIFVGVALRNLLSSIEIGAFQFLKNGLALFFVLFGSVFAFTKGGIRSNDNVLTLKDNKK